MKKIFIFVILILLICPIFFNSVIYASEILDNTTTVNYSEVGNPDIKDLEIFSDCILMIEKNTGDFLYAKNAYKKMYPASTTKILTAILVLENCNLNETVTVSSSALEAVPPTYAVAKLKVRRNF